jgi:ribose transport system permease protein
VTALARRSLRIGEFWPALVFAALFVVLVALKGRFNPFDLRALVVTALPLVIVALGQFIIILTRGIDLSLGPIASVSGAVMALTVTDNPALGLALPILIGLAAGLLNGGLVVGLGLPPIIVTLATMSIWQGVALVVLPNPGGSIPDGYQSLLLGDFSSPIAGVITMVIFAVLAIWLLGTRYGLAVRAIGGDELAAGLSGVRVRRTKIIAYVLGGLLAGIAGMYMAIALSSGSPTEGDDYILTSIAAVVLGGIPLVGGRGSPLAVVMGALILTITASLLYFAQVSSFYQSLINGAILLVVVGSRGAGIFVRGLVRG